MLQLRLTLSIGEYDIKISDAGIEHPQAFKVEVQRVQPYSQEEEKVLWSGQYIVFIDDNGQPYNKRHKSTPPDAAHWVEIKDIVNRHILANI